MTKIHNNFDFVGGAKLTGLPSSTAAGEVVVHEQLAALSGGVTTATLAGDNNQPVTVASAATCDIGAAASQRVHITGTTTITSFGTSVGRLRFVTFAAALTLTHNATSLILPTGASITTAAGDSGVFMSDGTGNWTCLAYLRKSGKGVIPPVTADISGLDTYLAMLAAGGRLGALSQATAAADLNVVVDTGFYRLGAAHTNAPAVYSFGMLLVHRSGDVIKQVVTSYNGQSQYWRSGNPSDVGGAGSWGAWRQYVDGDNVASFAALTCAPLTSGTAILKGNGSGGFSAAAAGTDYLSSGVITSGNLGYGTGTGGTVTQTTSQTTAVTLNKMSGKITTVSLSITDTSNEFTFNNSLIGADDILVLQGQLSTAGRLSVRGNSAGSRIIRIDTISTLSGVQVIPFVVLKVATS